MKQKPMARCIDWHLDLEAAGVLLDAGGGGEVGVEVEVVGSVEAAAPTHY